jgi:hypothetical protein
MAKRIIIYDEVKNKKRWNNIWIVLVLLWQIGILFILLDIYNDLPFALKTFRSWYWYGIGFAIVLGEISGLLYGLYDDFERRKGRKKK